MPESLEPIEQDTHSAELPLTDLEFSLHSLGYEMPELGCSLTRSRADAQCRVVVRKTRDSPLWQRC